MPSEGYELYTYNHEQKFFLKKESTSLYQQLLSACYSKSPVVICSGWLRQARVHYPWPWPLMFTSNNELEEEK